MTPPSPALTALDPVIEPAAPTFVTATPRLLDAPLPLPLEGVTVILPEVAEHPKSTVIEVVSWPLVIVAPDGTDHV